jgi:hypothetical protein
MKQVRLKSRRGEVKRIWMKLFVAGLLCASLGEVGVAATPSWTLLTTSSGGGNYESVARYSPAVVYNPASNKMIMFGGAIGGGPNGFTNFSDLWVETNANGIGGTGTWNELIANGDPSSPSPRHGQLAVFDAANNRMILFGGCEGGCLPVANDVWVLSNADGTAGSPTWQQLSPTGTPPAARTWGAAVYDPNSNSLIIFGGQDGGGCVVGCTYSDTWVLSNANGLGGTPAWTQLSTTGGPPPGQYGPSAVYDSVNNVMTVFGGDSGSTGKALNSVWTLSHANGQGGTPVWTNIVAQGASGSPPSRAFHTAIYDPGSNRMTVFGGSNSNNQSNILVLNDAWVLDNANGIGGTPAWSKLAVTGKLPAQRDSHGAVYDSTNNRMIVFGGTGPEGYFYSTWVLTDANGE